MKILAKTSIIFLILMSFTMSGIAQDDQTPPPPKKEEKPSRVYYGGEIGVSFGDYFSVSLRPLVGYAVTPKWSMGMKVMYQYVSDSQYSETLTSNNYGGSIFTRYRFIPQVYAHAEYAYLNYEQWTYSFLPLPDGEYKSARVNVPFLLLGAGYLQPVGKGVALNFEVLFDVMNDPDSPYASGEPFISIGVWVGV